MTKQLLSSLVMSFGCNIQKRMAGVGNHWHIQESTQLNQEGKRKDRVKSASALKKLQIINGIKNEGVRIRGKFSKL